jgi:hypothetical protein
LLQKVCDNKILFDFQSQVSGPEVIYGYVFNEILKAKMQFFKNLIAELEPENHETSISKTDIVDFVTSPQLLIIDKVSQKQMAIYFSKKDPSILKIYDRRLSHEIESIHLSYDKFNNNSDRYTELLIDILNLFRRITTEPEDIVTPDKIDPSQHSPASFHTEQVLGVRMEDGTIYTKEVKNPQEDGKNFLKSLIPTLSQAKNFDTTDKIILYDQQVNVVYYFDQKENKSQSAIIIGQYNLNIGGMTHILPMAIKSILDSISEKFSFSYWGDKISNWWNDKEEKNKFDYVDYQNKYK